MPTFGDCELAWTNINRKSVKKIVFEYNGLIGKEKERFHPTQKPVGLFSKIISEYFEANVYDPFLGSGTTLVACEQTGRVGYGMEIDAGYVAVTLQRLNDMGLTPELTN
jgi:DNA modification methylase